MASEQGGQPRGPMAGVATDAAKLGYQAVELVFEGLRESVRLQSARVTGQPSPQAPTGPTVPVRGDQSQPTNLVGDIAAIIAEVLTRAGSAANEIAHTLTDQTTQPSGGAASVPELAIAGVGGETTTLEFSVWNTGATALHQITMGATDLVGAGHRTSAGAITFTPSLIAQLGPGKSELVEVAIKIPLRLAPGTYRGLIQAEPGDTCAVIELAVTAPEPRARTRTSKKQ